MPPVSPASKNAAAALLAALTCAACSSAEVAVSVDAGGADQEAGMAPKEWAYGTDCPNPTLPSVPAESPRILILGPVADTQTIATHLQGMLAGDSAFTSPLVTGLTTETVSTVGDGVAGISLMNFFYMPEARDQRLALLSQP